MSLPTVLAVTEASPAARSGLSTGDQLVSVNGTHPRDVIEYVQLTDGSRVDLVVRRAGQLLDRRLTVRKQEGEPLGLEVSSAVFDRVKTCDNHCAFCFIHQLPKGMRRSLYLKDDDYRLSFLYGNFTTLTRFTELDAERILDQRLGPLYVSIHATDPAVRASMLRNPRGAISLRWLRILLEGGIEVHGQVVVCPGINDGPVLESTLIDILDRYPALASVGIVPLGISDFTKEPELRAHTRSEAQDVCDTVSRWQEEFHAVLGHRMVQAADEYYLLAGRPFPGTDTYEGFTQHENGIGMARAFEDAFCGQGPPRGVHAGFFAAVDGAPADGYRAPRTVGEPATDGEPATVGEHLAVTPAAGTGTVGTAVVTGTYGARVLRPLIGSLDRPDVRLVTVGNDFFGGNIGVAGLLTGEDLARALRAEPEGHRYLLPDACLSQGRFLDGLTPADLPHPVEIVPTDGASLRHALGGVR